MASFPPSFFFFRPHQDGASHPSLTDTHTSAPRPPRAGLPPVRGKPRSGYSAPSFRPASFRSAAASTPRCRSRRTCCTPRPRRRSGSTRRSAWCRAPTPTSWTSSARVATKSPRFSVTPRQLCCVSAARLCCASPLVERQG